MMKAQLEFEDEQELRLAINGRQYFCCLWDTFQTLRGWAKHGIGEKNFEDCCAHLMDDIADSVDFSEID